ncbi:unnamed protein product [Mytilus coruscus]|uniref:Uncharacterized protein n=1 Tax=Mytilus coruscus TaxID=42192 RepID=A0A6J8CJP0_MYTCO|nr:unnamed protein product [Mytilus coruscus]
MKYLRQRNKNIKRKYKGQSALLRYYRNKNLKKENSNETVDSIKKSGIRMDSDMENRMKYLENENEILKENIEDLMKSQIVQTFHGGKYNDTIREVYASLLSMNVGVCNVEKIIRTVLEKMGGLKVERLPKKTFAETMLIEAKIIAQLQATEAMLSSKNNTLHTDGTKRDGREFGGLQIGTDSGQYSIGLVEMLRGDTENF